MTLLVQVVRSVVVVGVIASGAAQASPKSHDRYGGVPDLDVKGSCQDAQKFSSQGNDKGVAYKGCMQDEMSAKDQLAKRWSTFKGSDKQTCVEQARAPSPSYVEVLTCLEMNTDGLNTGGKATGSQIGGASSTGLRPQAAPTPDK